MLIAKACPIVTRTRHGSDILVFRHPLAGMQLVKGTVEVGESPAAAALRELHEEAGVRAEIVGAMGTSTAIVQGSVWHMFRCRTKQLPERWTRHTADGGGLNFAFEWWPLGQGPGSDWQSAFARALDFVAVALRSTD